MKRLLVSILYLASMLSAFAFGNRTIEDALKDYIVEKDARIGIAVIINGKDTVSINGERDFPMMSVSKFPLALTIAHWIDAHGMSLNDSITFNEAALHENTYSPMLKKYGKNRNIMSIRELLEWSLVDSDNNAADILLNYIGDRKRICTAIRI